MGFDSSEVSWTRYWRAGNRDTCFTADGAFSIEERWASFFNQLTGGASVLDLATGNGAVALIAAKTGKDKEQPFLITAVDQADISPQDSLQNPSSLLNTIYFIPNTPIESLPFTDQSFDAICSQFGFEYSDIAKSLQEIIRLSKPSAKLCLVIHAKNGDIEQSSKNRLRRVHALVGKGRVVESIFSIAQLQLESSSSNRARIQKLEKRVLDKLKKSLQQLAGVVNDDVALSTVNYLGSILSERQQMNPAEFNSIVRDISKELHAYIVRLNTMINAAQSQQDMNRIEKQLCNSGFTDIQVEAINDGNNIVAWQLLASR
tara:strand:- start:1328 stop:2278 length:951 start_codon:yes stop_codon:yes gene_type:complete